MQSTTSKTLHLAYLIPPSLSISAIHCNGRKTCQRRMNAQAVQEVRVKCIYIISDDTDNMISVCGIETDYNLADGTSSIKKVVPIAGEYTSSNGRSMDPTLERLKNSASHGDSEREGVRVVLNGGNYPFDKSSGTPQKAIIEFVCDPDRTGLEHVEGDSREKVDDAAEGRMKRRADDDKKEDGDKGGDKGDDKDKEEEDDASLKFISYKTEGEADREAGVLRLEWRTKYACEGQTEHEPSKGKSNHWGFFTWFLIM